MAKSKSELSEASAEIAESSFPKGVSLKAFLFSIVFIIGLSIFIQHAEFTMLIDSVNTAMMPSVAGILGVSVAVLADRLAKRLRFSRADLAVIYVMVSVGGLYASIGLVGLSIGNIGSLSALRLQNADVYQPIFELFSSAVVLKGEEATLGFLLGSGSVPWDKWVLPLVTWTVFWSVLFFLFLCMVSLVRKQWTEYEKLTFPLLKPINLLIDDLSSQAGSKMHKNRYVVAGMMLPVFFSALGILNRFIPAIPVPSLTLDLAQFFTEPPFDAVKEWPSWVFMFDMKIIGLGYLISLDMSLSLWLFYLIINKLAAVILQQNTGTLYYLNMRYDIGRGVFVACGLYYLWLARTQIKRIIISAFSSSKHLESEDTDEILPSKVAVWGGLAAIVFIAVFSTTALHMTWLGFVPFLFVFFMTSFAFARLRAEAGYPWNQPPMGFTQIYLARGITQDRLGPVNSYGLGTLFKPADTGRFGAGPALALEACKLADDVGVKRSSIVKAIVASFLIAVIVGYVAALPVIYKHGMLNMEEFHRVHAVDSLAHMSLPPMTGYVGGSYLIGAVLGFVTMYMRTKYIWWPFSPLAIGIAPNPWMANFWGGFFVAWLVKFSVNRYGGYKTVRELEPFFLGLILGEVGMSVVRTLIGVGINLFG